jgi:hypothetical protein
MNKIFIYASLLVLLIFVAVYPLFADTYSYVDFKGQTYMAKIISVLPEKTKKSRLFRIFDREAGVICYVIQNDTADFYSGLQCLPINQTSLGKENQK